MNDHDTLELRRIVDSDLAHPAPPDVARLRSAGAARLRRRRIGVGAAALATAAAVAAPTYVLTGAATGQATDPTRIDVATDSSAPPQHAADGLQCGVLSCIDPKTDRRETGTVVDSVGVGSLPNGAEELLYLVRTRGVDLRANEKGQVDVLKAGYRFDGEVYGTAWALQPGYQPADAPRFWANPGLISSTEDGTGNYVVLGYVDGAPQAITWSTPDGMTGEVDGILRLDGYTAFYLTRPMPDDYVPPNRVTRNDDGSLTVETEDGPLTIDGGSLTTETGDGLKNDGKTEVVDVKELLGEHAYEGFPPALTIHTSDGWSCSLEDCGSAG